jgi:hypothetical protein
MGLLPYLLLVLVPTILITGWAALRVRSTYGKWDKVDSGIRMSAFDFARYLLNQQGLNDVAVEPTPGHLAGRRRLALDVDPAPLPVDRGRDAGRAQPVLEVVAEPLGEPRPGPGGLGGDLAGEAQEVELAGRIGHGGSRASLATRGAGSAWTLERAVLAPDELGAPGDPWV